MFATPPQSLKPSVWISWGFNEWTPCAYRLTMCLFGLASTDSYTVCLPEPPAVLSDGIRAELYMTKTAQSCFPYGFVSSQLSVLSACKSVGVWAVHMHKSHVVPTVTHQVLDVVICSKEMCMSVVLTQDKYGWKVYGYFNAWHLAHLVQTKEQSKLYVYTGFLQMNKQL